MTLSADVAWTASESATAIGLSASFTAAAYPVFLTRSLTESAPVLSINDSKISERIWRAREGINVIDKVARRLLEVYSGAKVGTYRKIATVKAERFMPVDNARLDYYRVKYGITQLGNLSDDEISGFKPTMGAQVVYEGPNSYVIPTLEGKMMDRAEKPAAPKPAAPKPAAPARQPAPTPAPAAPAVEAGIPAEVVAAIAAAVACTEGGGVIRAVRRAPAAGSRRGNWGDAGVVANTTPFLA